MCPVAIVAGDFTSNGVLDLATADSNGMEPTTTPCTWATATARSSPTSLRARWIGGFSSAMVTGDFAGNGRTDLAITRTSPDDVQVRLSNGDGTFSSPSVVDLVRRETPLVADVNGDGAPDVSVVDAAGDILYPAPAAGRARQFASPGHGQPRRPVSRYRFRLDPVRSGAGQCRRQRQRDLVLRPSLDRLRPGCQARDRLRARPDPLCRLER